MSMRISLVQTMPANNKIGSSSSSSSTDSDPSSSSSSSEFYVRNNKISNKSKSPFRKYEKCVRGEPSSSSTEGTSKGYNSTRSRSSKNLTSTTSFSVDQATNTILFTHEAPLDDSNNSQANNTRSSRITENQLAKKSEDKAGSIRSFGSEKQTQTEPIDQKTNATVEDLVGRAVVASSGSKSNNNKAPQYNKSNNSNNNNNNSREAKACQTEQDGSSHGMSSTLEITANMKSGTERKVRFNLNLDDDDNEYDANDQSGGVEFYMDSAEQIIDSLMQEDVKLRRKIADGDTDSRTLRKLERINQIRLKYAKFREEHDNYEAATTSSSSSTSSRDAATEYDVTNYDTAGYHYDGEERDEEEEGARESSSSSSGSTSLVSEDQFGNQSNIETVIQVDILKTNSHVANAKNAQTKLLYDQVREQYHAPTVSSFLDVKPVKTAMTTTTKTTTTPRRLNFCPVYRQANNRLIKAESFLPLINYSSGNINNNNSDNNKNSNKNSHSTSSNSSRVLYCTRMIRTTTTTTNKQVVSSFSDSAFSSELKFHPLIRQNAYLRAYLE